MAGTAANLVKWNAFGSVAVVSSTADSGTGSLRAAVNTANNDAAAGPWLIRFNHQALGSMATISLETEQVRITAAETMIDGTNDNGHPSPIATFTDRIYPVRIHQNPNQAHKSTAHAARIFVRADEVRIEGLSLFRTLPPDPELPGDLDAITVGFGSARKVHIRTCLIDGGAAARTAANDSAAQGKDGIDVEAAQTTSLEDAVVIENTEIRHCYDRPLKSQNAHVIARDNWIHNNLRAGPFAQNPNGMIRAERNLIEHNGKAA